MPLASGNLLFHVIVDDFNRTFSMDAPGGPNGIRLHYEMMRICRASKKKKLRDFDLRAESPGGCVGRNESTFSRSHLLRFLGQCPSKRGQSQFKTH